MGLVVGANHHMAHGCNWTFTVADMDQVLSIKLVYHLKRVADVSSKQKTFISHSSEPAFHSTASRVQ
jgi:hypothetical protein